MIKSFLKKNKTLSILFALCIIVILRNIYMIATYSMEEDNLNKQIVEEKLINKELKEDIQTLKSKRYILIYAIENLNLKPKDISILVSPDDFKLDLNKKDTEEKENESKLEEKNEDTDSKQPIVENKEEINDLEKTKNEENNVDTKNPKVEDTKQNDEEKDNDEPSKVEDMDNPLI